MALKDAIAKGVMRQFGIGPDSSLEDLIEMANENFSLGLDLKQVPSNPTAAVEALTAIGAAAELVIRSGNAQAKLFRLTARPEGKPPIHAFVVMGGEP